MSKEALMLTYDNFGEHCVENMRDLYHDKCFTDVTLVSDDLSIFTAHKIVLTSASSVIKKLLLLIPESKKVLYWKGVMKEELEAILQFIYLGEAKVFSERMPTFLKHAAELHINGLNMEYRLEEESYEASRDPLQAAPMEVEVKTEILQMEDKTELQEPIQSKPNIHEKIKNTTENGKSYFCQECNKSYRNSTGLKLHSDTRHQGITFLCQYKDCDKVYSGQGALKKHIRAFHEGFFIKCYHCEKSFNDKGNLSRHVKMFHSEENEHLS